MGKPCVVPQDPDDDHAGAAIIAVRADLIASGDQRDLLPLANYQGILIVDVRGAVIRLHARRRGGA